MSAPTQGWAQRREQSNPGGAVNWALNATVGTTQDPTVKTLATSSVFEVTAGTSVSIRWGCGGGASAPGSSATATTATYLSLFDETTQTLYDGAADSVSVVNTSGSNPVAVTCHDHVTTTNAAQTAFDRTLTFTPTHSGMVRLFVRQASWVSATNTILSDVNTDAGNFGSHAETFATTEASTDFTPGMMRAGTALSTWAQSSGAGNVYYPSTQQNTLTLAAAPAASEGSFSIAWKQGTTTVLTTTIAAFTTTSASDTAQKITWANSFAASATAVTYVLTPSSSTLSTSLGGAGIPWLHFTSVPAGVTNAGDPSQVLTFSAAFTADPRIFIDHLLQVNDNTFGTPPLSKDIASDQRLTTDLGFVATRIRNNNGVGINGLTVVQTLRDTSNLTTELTQSSTTATQGGDDGWTSLLTWSATLPGGHWPMDDTGGATAFSVTDANGAIPTSYWLNNNEVLTLIAANPNIKAYITREPDASTNSDSWAPGQSLTLFFSILNGTPMVDTCLTPDAGSVNMAILWADETSKTLKALGNDNLFHAVTGSTFTTFAATVSPNDVCLYSLSFTASNTASWPETGLVLFGQGTVSGSPYVVVTPLF